MNDFPLPSTPPYNAQRQNNHAPFGDQLDHLWHDIDLGLFGAAAKTGDFYTSIKAIKDQFPKP